MKETKALPGKRFQSVRRVFGGLAGTPLHPQWHVQRLAKRSLDDLGERLRGTVLDIGCADQQARRCIAADGRYIGLDYYQTATQWYATRPDVYGDAQALPFPDRSMDCVLLLDVLEHLQHPGLCLHEVRRVLKPGGTLTLQVPFVYPIHDAPLDFTRWTLHGLRALAREYGFVVEKENAMGHPLETAALLANIAFSQSVLNWFRRRNPAALSILLLPFFVLLTNLTSWAAAKIACRDDLMPVEYRCIWRTD